MPFILTSAPAVEPVSLADAKAHLRVAHTDEDALIGTLITAARLRAEAETGLRFITQGWSAFADAWPPGGTLELPLAPLISVSDVKVYGDDDTPATIDPAHYVVDRHSRPPRLVLRPDRVWARPGRLVNGIEVLLVAGFGPAAADVPATLREAMLKLVAHWFSLRGEDAEMKSLPPGFLALTHSFREARL